MNTAAVVGNMDTGWHTTCNIFSIAADLMLITLSRPPAKALFSKAWSQLITEETITDYDTDCTQSRVQMVYTGKAHDLRNT